MNWIDNPVTRVLSRICDFVVLNILWIVCCIPIVTIGASTSALYSVMLKVVKNEEGYIVRGFLKGFKENFKKSTILWLIMILVAGVVLLDLRALGVIEMSASLKTVFRGVVLFVGLMLLCVSLYIFPLLARYENTIKQTIKNALILSVIKLPYTVLMLIVTIGPAVAAFFSAKLMVLGFVVWLVIGGTLVAWINSFLLRKVFTIFDDK